MPRRAYTHKSNLSQTFRRDANAAERAHFIVTQALHRASLVVVRQHQRRFVGRRNCDARGTGVERVLHTLKLVEVGGTPRQLEQPKQRLGEAFFTQRFLVITPNGGN
jgi:hypothetical protein